MFEGKLHHAHSKSSLFTIVLQSPLWFRIQGGRGMVLFLISPHPPEGMHWSAHIPIHKKNQYGLADFSIQYKHQFKDSKTWTSPVWGLQHLDWSNSRPPNVNQYSPTDYDNVAISFTYITFPHTNIFVPWYFLTSVDRPRFHIEVPSQ